MEPKKRIMESLSPHNLAVRALGVLTLALDLISLTSKLRPAAIGIAPLAGCRQVGLGHPGARHSFLSAMERD